MAYYDDDGDVQPVWIARDLVDHKGDRSRVQNPEDLEAALSSLDLTAMLANLVGVGLNQFDYSTDIEADEITREDILAATLMWDLLLQEKWGTVITKILHARIPQRIYVNGLVAGGSRKGFLIKPVTEHHFETRNSGHELQWAIDALQDIIEDDQSSEDEFNDASFQVDVLRNGISVGEYKDWYLTGGARDMVSKTMILRVYVDVLYHIHNTVRINRPDVIARNVFMTSLEHCEYDMASITTPSELLFFGANHHRDFKALLLKDRKSYFDAREAIFKYSSEGSKTKGENRGV